MCSDRHQWVSVSYLTWKIKIQIKYAPFLGFILHFYQLFWNISSINTRKKTKRKVCLQLSSAKSKRWSRFYGLREIKYAKRSLSQLSEAPDSSVQDRHFNTTFPTTPWLPGWFRLSYKIKLPEANVWSRFTRVPARSDSPDLQLLSSSESKPNILEQLLSRRWVWSSSSWLK